MKALTVVKEDRIESVEEFADGMRTKKSHTKMILLVTAFLLIIAGGIGYKPFMEFREEQALYDRIQDIKNGNKAKCYNTLVTNWKSC